MICPGAFPGKTPARKIERTIAAVKKATTPQRAPTKIMNNQNPLIPQGSLLEQKAKTKPHLRVAYVIVAVHLVFLGGLLIQGCKKEDPTGNRAGLSTNETSLPPLGQAELPSNSIAPTGNLAFPDIATSV